MASHSERHCLCARTEWFIIAAFAATCINRKSFIAQSVCKLFMLHFDRWEKMVVDELCDTRTIERDKCTLSHCRSSHRTNGMLRTRKTVSKNAAYSIVLSIWNSQAGIVFNFSFHFVSLRRNAIHSMFDNVHLHYGNMSKHQTTIIPHSTLENGSLRRIQLRAHSCIKYAIIISRHSKLWCPRPSLQRR